MRSGSAGLYLVVLAASADIHTATAIGPYQKVAIHGHADPRTVVPDDSCYLIKNEFGNEGNEPRDCVAFTDATDCGWPLEPTPAVLWSGGFSVAENGHLRLISLSLRGEALEVLDGGSLVLEGVAVAGGAMTARNVRRGAVSLSGSCSLSGDFKLLVLGEAQLAVWGAPLNRGADGRIIRQMVTVDGGTIGEYVSANFTAGGSLRLSHVALPLRALVGAEAQLGVVFGTKSTTSHDVLALENVTVQQSWGALNIEVWRHLGDLTMVPNILPCCGYGLDDIYADEYADSPYQPAVRALGRFSVPTDSACPTGDGGRCVGQPDSGSSTEVELCQIEVTGGGGVLATTTVWDVVMRCSGWCWPTADALTRSRLMTAEVTSAARPQRGSLCRRVRPVDLHGTTPSPGETGASDSETAARGRFASRIETVCVRVCEYFLKCGLQGTRFRF